MAAEAALFVDPADTDIDKLGQALAEGRHGDRDELMANAAAYTAGCGEAS